MGLNVQPFDAYKHGALPLIADAREGLRQLSEALGDWRAPRAWTERAQAERTAWRRDGGVVHQREQNGPLPSDAQVIGAVQQSGAGIPTSWSVPPAACPGSCTSTGRPSSPAAITSSTAFPAWATRSPGALGVKLAHPEREVIVMVGDGSYLMLNSEIATSVRMGLKLIVVLLDNGGFGCIERLQSATGNASFNNLRAIRRARAGRARPGGARAQPGSARQQGARTSPQLASALAAARRRERTSVLVIETDPASSTAAGGHWWDVAVPEVSDRAEVRRGSRALRGCSPAARRTMIEP